MISYHKTKQSVLVVITIDGQTETKVMDSSHQNFQTVLDELRNKTADEKRLLELLTPGKMVPAALEKVNLPLEWKNGELLYGGEPQHGFLVDLLLRMERDGFPLEPYVAFARKLFANPLTWVRQELPIFLEKGGMPITPDGDFLAYKKVHSNYNSINSNPDGSKNSNTIGTVVEMDRSRVESSRAVTCASGLHFCSQSYLSNFGGSRVMVLKINPADVVSIPHDYNDSKGRCCRYEVIGEVSQPWAEKTILPPVVNSTPTKKERVMPTKQAVKPTKTVTSEKRVVNSEVAGRLTPTGFKKLLKEHGSQAALARHFRVSTGTVAAWKRVLGV